MSSQSIPAGSGSGSGSPRKKSGSSLAYAAPLDHAAFAVAMERRAEAKAAAKRQQAKQEKEQNLLAKTTESDNASIFSFSSFNSTTGFFKKDKDMSGR